MQLHFITVNVFTYRPFGGNPRAAAASQGCRDDHLGGR
jgi:predicted PhzF superfamily epimerase YddE/YHI9